MIRVLCVGDVSGDDGIRCLKRLLPGLKREFSVDVTLVNGENAGKQNSLSPETARQIYEAGADVITGGNHTFRNPALREMLETDPCLLRPANWGKKGVPGRDVALVDRGRYRLAVVNLIGVTYMNPAENPFYALDEILEELDTPLVVVDFHAEATGEKRAMGFAFDGKVSALFGTHTHVQTADAQILPGQTGYITDVGMTGVVDSVLGVKKEIIISWMKDHLPAKFTLEEGNSALCGVLFTLDEKTGRCLEVQTIRREEPLCREGNR